MSERDGKCPGGFCCAGGFCQDPATDPHITTEDRSDRKRRKREVIEHPLVQAAVEVLDAEVTEVRLPEEVGGPCPACGKNSVQSGYGLTLGGVGAYEFCTESRCDYFKKTQDED